MCRKLAFSVERIAYSILFWLFAVCCLSLSVCFAAEQNAQSDSDQQISEFSLAGYGEKGQKTWDIAGKSADIFENVVKLQEVVGNLYGEEEDIHLVSDKGDFDKKEGGIHLEDNVVITTSAGTKLTTDSLDWDRKKQLVKTEDTVNIIRDNMVTVGKGVLGEPNLNKVMLKEEVQVDINNAEEGKPADPKNKIVITCDGPLEVEYEKQIATFKNNVKVVTQDNEMYSDIMHIYFKDSSQKDPTTGMQSKIDKIIARGNVKIIQGENTSFSEEAVYNSNDRKIVLTGRPKLVLYSTEGLNASAGN